MADARRERARGGGGRGRGGRGGGGRGGGHSQAQSGRGSNWFKGEGYNDNEAVSIDEQVVGISGFLAPTRRGFGGLVKQRFSDFIVRELPRGSGAPVALTSLARKKKHVSASFQELVGAFSGPTEEKKELLEALGERLGRRGHQLKLEGARAAETRDMRRMVALVTNELGKKKGKDFEDFVARVAQLKRAERERQAAAADAATSTSTSEPAEQEELEFYIGGLNEKSERVFLHETMRRYGKGLVVADTITSEDQSQVIRVRRAFAPGEAKKGDRKSWPIDQPEYLQFVLYRRNKDVGAVLNQIASVLKVSPSVFAVADPKDKRGIVTQLCTAHRLPAEKLQALHKFHASAKPLDDYQYLVGGNLKYVVEPLRAGDCRGNRFSIVVRALAKRDLATPDEVQETVAHWRATGFVNFFGLQRFGSSATPLHLIGRAVLRKDFKLAVLLLLRPQDGEASKIREAREHFRQHKDVAAALRMLPPYLVAERAVLDGLLQHGIDANELAFRNIPLAHRAAYVDAYLNYVWNEMASLRVAQLPRDRAVVGDLVFAKAEDDVAAPAAGDEPAAKKQKLAADSGSSSSARAAEAKPRVIALTEANVDAYAIDDVVLPLPGYAVAFPTHAVGAAYQKMLTTDGVDLASWLGAQQPYQQLEGSYRHVIKKPFDVSAHVTEYENMNTPLQLTDVDRLLGRSLASWSAATSARAAAAAAPGVPEDATATPDELQQAGPRKLQRALVLSFSLDHGADATIALRELMKQSSSMHIQWQLADKAQRASGAAPDSSRPAGGGVGASGSKRSRGGVLVSTTDKTDKKIVAQKKTHVSIGRPGFSLGKH